MEKLLIYPENDEQLKAVKAFLSSLNVKYAAQDDELPEFVISKVEEGIEQYGKGNHISLEEFKSKHFTNK